ncbi:ACT domain-containing protein [Erythrobacter sp. HA6-11]
MAGPISKTSAMIAQMDPELDSMRYCFVIVTPDIAPQVLGSALATFREDEGVSAIVPESLAHELEIEGPVFARITLQVHSGLESVGLTAAVSGALAEVGIACNVVAAYHHDHLFVPVMRAEEALAVLQTLSRSPS